MNVVIYSRVSTLEQENERQITNLKTIAEQRGWTVKRIFQEKVTGVSKTGERPEYVNMMNYLPGRNISLVMISEVSRLGRKVVHVINAIEDLHKIEVGLYIQNFNMISFEGGKPVPVTMMMMQMLSIGAQMEFDQRKERQLQGIAIAKIKGVYKGKVKGTVMSLKDMKERYATEIRLIEKSTLSLRDMAKLTGRSVNTIQRIKKMI